MNASGQVAYSTGSGLGSRARFFDGTTSRDISPEPAMAVAINANGQVGGQFVSPSGGARAFVWNSATQGLTQVDSQPGVYTIVEQINATGQVAGTYTRQNFSQAFRGIPGVTSDPMPSLPVAQSGIPMASALFINAGGTATGISAVDTTPHVHAALWLPGAPADVRDLGTLGGFESWPAALNDAGQIAGKSDTAASGTHAFLWSETAGMQDLGTLGGRNSAATALNANGAVAGNSDSDAGSRAFRWQSGSMVSLGTLGGASSAATAIDSAGHVGGTAQTADGAQHAFLWSPEDGMVDLNARLAGTGAPTLQSVIALTDNGMVLASSTGGLVMLRPQP